MSSWALRQFLLGFLALGLCVAPASAQNSAGQAALNTQIEAKRMEIRHHTELIQSIQDPARLQSETQKHFLMIEEMLALVLEQERQTLQVAGAPSTGAMGGMEGEDAMEMPSGAPPTGSAGGMAGGAAGGMGDDAMEMPSPPAPSGAPAAGSTGGMAGSAAGGMGDDAMEMPSPPAPSGAPAAGSAGGMAGGHKMMMEMGGMKGGAASGPTPTAAASAAARRMAQREALLKEIDTHSAYLASISDPATRARETIKHQEMLDRLLDLMR